MTHFRSIHLLKGPFLGDRIALGVVADGVKLADERREELAFWWRAP